MNTYTSNLLTNNYGSLLDEKHLANILDRIENDDKAAALLVQLLDVVVLQTVLQTLPDANQTVLLFKQFEQGVRGFKLIDELPEKVVTKRLVEEQLIRTLSSLL